MQYFLLMTYHNLYIIFNIVVNPCPHFCQYLEVWGVWGEYLIEREGLTLFPLFLLGKREEITEKRKADRANKTNLPPPPYNVVQGLDLPL